MIFFYLILAILSASCSNSSGQSSNVQVQSRDFQAPEHAYRVPPYQQQEDETSDNHSNNCLIPELEEVHSLDEEKIEEVSQKSNESEQKDESSDSQISNLIISATHENELRQKIAKMDFYSFDKYPNYEKLILIFIKNILNNHKIIKNMKDQLTELSKEDAKNLDSYAIFYFSMNQKEFFYYVTNEENLTSITRRWTSSSNKIIPDDLVDFIDYFNQEPLQKINKNSHLGTSAKENSFYYLICATHEMKKQKEGFFIENQKQTMIHFIRLEKKQETLPKEEEKKAQKIKEIKNTFLNIFFTIKEPWSFTLKEFFSEKIPKLKKYENSHLEISYAYYSSYCKINIKLPDALTILKKLGMSDSFKNNQFYEFENSYYILVDFCEFPVNFNNIDIKTKMNEILPENLIRKETSILFRFRSLLADPLS